MSEETFTVRITGAERTRLLFALGCLAGRLYDGTDEKDQPQILETMQLANKIGLATPDTEAVPKRNIR